MEKARALRDALKAGKEGEESSELFKGSIGFDFVFSKDEQGHKKCYCVEINGHQTGVRGIADIPKGQVDETKRILSRIRGEYNPKYLLLRQLKMDTEDGEFSLSDEAFNKVGKYLSSKVSKTPMFPNAHQNPPFVERIADNKQFQTAVIPRENQPRVLLAGASMISSSGYWMLKPRTGRHGTGIRILSNEEFENFIKPEMTVKYTIQEFVHSAGADKAPEDLKGAPASMRMLIDFQYLQDGHIVPLFEAAYQRVVPFPSSSSEISRRLAGARESLLVVGKANGAISAPVSEEELALAHPVAEEIIHNLANLYKGYLDRQEKEKARLSGER